MKILEKPITIDELRKIAADTFGDLVKAVVDVNRELIALDVEKRGRFYFFLIQGLFYNIF